MASILDKTIIKNNDYRLFFIVTDKAGSAVDITGFTIKYQVRKSVGTEPVITKTNSSGITLNNPTQGIFTVLVDAADTKFLVTGAYYHEAVMTDLFGNSTTLTDSALSFGILNLRDQIAVQS